MGPTSSNDHHPTPTYLSHIFQKELSTESWAPQAWVAAWDKLTRNFFSFPHAWRGESGRNEGNDQTNALICFISTQLPWFLWHMSHKILLKLLFVFINLVCCIFTWVYQLPNTHSFVFYHRYIGIYIYGSPTIHFSCRLPTSSLLFHLLLWQFLQLWELFYDTSKIMFHYALAWASERLHDWKLIEDQAQRAHITSSSDFFSNKFCHFLTKTVRKILDFFGFLV